ncbi:MAG: squalene--hopene cyclase [Gemmataceae bacterium]|nr:squalene--hopene cyclase [Gemmataceae bacterium]
MGIAALEPYLSAGRPKPGVPGLFPRALEASHKAGAFLASFQKPDGHWVAELQGDTILESEFILLMAFLGREKESICQAGARYIISHQRPEGGWSNYPGGPLDVSVSVKAYFALKLTGTDPELTWMKLAKEEILRAGGAEKCNSFSRFYLALLGEYPYANCPEVPPELVLLPGWCPFNIYSMSSWTRTILVPLSIFSAFKPVRQVSKELGIRELFVDDPSQPRWPSMPTPGVFSWKNFFLVMDLLVKKAAPHFPRIRQFAVEKAALWMRNHFAKSDGVGAIFPPMIYTVLALHCLGVPEQSKEFQWAMKQLFDLAITENGETRLQPCFSPVWDTALACITLADVNDPASKPGLARAVEWLMGKEVKDRGDCHQLHPDMRPSGWFFEYRNEFYPDIDDTVMVILALAKTGLIEKPSCREAVERAVRWIFQMQNRDGGWGAFDRDIDQEILTKVPFADHNAMLDPTCPDITARVLEALGGFGCTEADIHIRSAVEFIRKTQEPCGGWPGRWGVNYLYGTWQVLVGLRAVGFDMSSPMARAGVRWLKSCQQDNGAWGESCASYDDPAFAGKGDPTPSQTAWAILGLMAAGEENSLEVRAGLEYLIHNQLQDGSWEEEPFTGTGFPKVFYLRYHFYRVYFPAMALARFSCTHGYTAKE